LRRTLLLRNLRWTVDRCSNRTSATVCTQV